MPRALGAVQVINLERDLVKLRASLEEGGGADRASVEEVRWYVSLSFVGARFVFYSGVGSD